MGVMSVHRNVWPQHCQLGREREEFTTKGVSTPTVKLYCWYRSITSATRQLPQRKGLRHDRAGRVSGLASSLIEGASHDAGSGAKL